MVETQQQRLAGSETGDELIDVHVGAVAVEIEPAAPIAARHLLVTAIDQLEAGRACIGPTGDFRITPAPRRLLTTVIATELEAAVN